MHVSTICKRLVVVVGLCLGLVPASWAKETVKIAYIGPLTGGNAGIGLGARNSADLAVRQRNADPKAKYHYELVSLDDACEPEIGVQAATKAATDNSIIAGITHFCSIVALRTVGVYHRYGLPVVMWGVSAPEITYGNDFKEIHRVNGTMIEENRVAAAFMRSLNYKTWAILYDKDDYGKGQETYFRSNLTKQGGETLSEHAVGLDQTDFTNELTKIKAEKPQVIYMGSLAPLAIRVRLQMDKLGIKAVFQTASGTVSDAYIKEVGDKIAEGTISFLEGAPIDKLPGGKEFAAAYERQGYAEPVDALSPFSYAATNLVIDAIEKVGPNRKKVVDELNKTRQHPSLVGPITFDDHGQNTGVPFSKYVVQDGKWTLWEESDYAHGKRRLP